MNTSPLMNIPLRQISNVKQLLMSNDVRSQLQMVATSTMTPERLMRVVATTLRNTPSLAECEPMSFLGAMMMCAQMGLEPNTPAGLAYLVPFNKRSKVGDKWVSVKSAEVVIGYKGFKELAFRSGKVSSMHGDIVYEGDHFSHSYGYNQHCDHVPGGIQDKPIGAYFYVILNNGGKGHVYMTKAEIERHRDRYSKGWQDAVRNNKTDSSPWSKDWEAMWIKTCVRRLISRGDIPMSVELVDAVTVDETKVDFAAFAFDPRGGALIEADTIEDGNDSKEHSKDDQGEGNVVEDDKKAATPKEKAKAAPEGDSAPADDAQGQDTDDVGDPPTPDERDELKRLFDTMIDDWDKSGGMDAVRDFHADNIRKLKVRAKDLFGQLPDELRKDSDSGKP